MNNMLAIASGAITLALVFYTIGVFTERRAGSLRKNHLAFFYLGLVFDTTGTAFMSQMAHGGFASPIHAATGALAIVLMLVHAVWATVVYLRKNPEAIARFHRLSMSVWLVWLVPYICGMLMGIPAISLGSNAAALVAVGLSLAIGIIMCARQTPNPHRQA
ncbi:hypothetical protein JI75_04470 [Berryella intestinalis]|uniref:TIGR03987 family protein n=1 Tax=Berryella intestinalis TaxID=1531429 RepID=A0A0A8BA81_9ACTN|nr:HsmA family protein [Berryella intestinalis]AJC12032.1 hypothetical protein JI75_04470 [Berryella intestinalis]